MKNKEDFDQAVFKAPDFDEMKIIKYSADEMKSMRGSKKLLLEAITLLEKFAASPILVKFSRFDIDESERLMYTGEEWEEAVQAGQLVSEARRFLEENV